MNNATENNKFPSCCPVLWVSITSLASLAVAVYVLIPVILLYYHDYISTEVTVWIALGVLVAAVTYDYFLLFLINRNDKDTCPHNGTANGDNLRPHHLVR